MDLITEVNKIPRSEWPKIWCQFNCWNFAEELANMKPDWWDKVTGREAVTRKAEVNRVIMDYILSEVGLKACNRYWNKDRMTDEEHEEFWNNKMK